MIRALILTAAFATAFTGCGSDEETTPADTSPAPPPTKSDKGAEKPADAVEVSMENTQFVPMDVTVGAGGTITWVNDDPFAHTVTKESGVGPDFDSGTVDGGESYSETFDDAGVIDYLCTLHPGQTGTITVE